MKNILLLVLISTLFTSSSPSQPRPRMFEVRVEARISNCTSRHDVMVEARSFQEARVKAQRVVEHRLTTKVTGNKEIKRP